MIGVAEYNAQFALKARTLTADAMGNETASEAAVAGYTAVPCYLQALPVREVEVDGKLVHVTLKAVYCNVAASVVTTDHFLTISSVDYEIVDVSPTTPLKIIIEKKV